MRVYRERLGVPATWWLVAALCVVMLGTTLWAGLSIIVGAAVYLVLGGACAAGLLAWGALTIEVADGELRVGSRCLPLGQVGQVTALDRAQTRALRGPRANPEAYLLVRPYLPEAVYIEVVGQPADRPYWLIASRRPDELAAAVSGARPQHEPGGPWDDVARDHPAQPGAPGPADIVSTERDGNAW
jgi:hypothetical protein